MRSHVGRIGQEKLERTDFRATKLSRQRPVLLPVFAEISRLRESSMRTADNDWKQRQRTAASLIVTVADCFMTVLLFRRIYTRTRGIAPSAVR